jgi:hypothetical protein
MVQQSDRSLPHHCHSRPFAAIGHQLKMLQRGPPLQPFVQSAAFCLLKRQCAGPSVFLLRLGKWLPSEDVPETVLFGTLQSHSIGKRI